MKISPIRYMGNKRKLINKGLCDLFPDNIDVFYDLFGGSGIVGMNIDADKYILNELDEHVFGLYQMFKSTQSDCLIEHAKERIKSYELPTINTDKRSVGEQVREYYKEKYMDFRQFYNNNPCPRDLYVLMNYAMSQTMRFNKSGKFNMPFGNNRFIPEVHGVEIENFYAFLQKTTLYNKDYQDVEIEATSNSFIYLDPPYLGSVATYNENGAWDEDDNERLLKYLKEMDYKGFRWGLSNIIKNKHREDLQLIDWVKENNYNVHYFSDFDYYSFGKGKSESVEVYIYNY